MDCGTIKNGLRNWGLQNLQKYIFLKRGGDFRQFFCENCEKCMWMTYEGI